MASNKSSYKSSYSPFRAGANLDYREPDGVTQPGGTLPWAHSDPLQSFSWFPSTFKIFNNLGNLLFAQRQPKSAQREGFCHDFATVVHEPNRLALNVQTVSGFLLTDTVS
jgi:hypothetical protein